MICAIYLIRDFTKFWIGQSDCSITKYLRTESDIGSDIALDMI